MLRVRCVRGDRPFEYRNIDRSQCKDVIASHVRYFGRELVPDGAGGEKVVPVPPSDFFAEWQDGNGEWDESKPAEKIPTC